MNDAERLALRMGIDHVERMVCARIMVWHRAG